MHTGHFPDLSRLAFVDVETTGFSPARDRITEIGIVTLDADGRSSEWEGLLNPRQPGWEESRFAAELGRDALQDAPCFRDIAQELQDRLGGRSVIAHNARFDFSFLQAEFARLGVAFEAPVICSMRLSRRLFPEQRGHDLDAVARRHRLPDCGARHRALPDARLLQQFWHVLHEELSRDCIAGHIASLMQEPLLPGHLDPGLLDRLPEKPGVFQLQAADGRVLRAGKAANLRLHLRNYFRIDKASGKAQAIAHLVSNITWQETRGLLGAQLQLNALTTDIAKSARGLPATEYFRLDLDPTRYPSARVTELSCEDFSANTVYGPYESERKARNALQRIATAGGLCHMSLGLSPVDCTGCVAGDGSTCGGELQRLRHLAAATAAFSALRAPPWPHAGAIGIREGQGARCELHVVKHWCYLGTARSEIEAHDLMAHAQPRFDRDTYEFLRKVLARLPKSRVITLGCPQADAVSPPDSVSSTAHRARNTFVSPGH